MSCTCGCCEGIELSTPKDMANRPGLDALAYRIGTHTDFFESMRARLSGRDLPALGALRTRDPGDPAIALLDASAVVLDLLTFYQERIANEAYLRTATERRSILELARLVGYRLRPGVAANVYLAYELEKDQRVVIPKGSRVQSVPEAKELPQTFETSDDLDARVEWNALTPRLTRPQVRLTIEPEDGPPRLYFQGVDTGLAPGGALLVVWDGKEAADLFVVRAVEPRPPEKRTLVRLDPWEPITMHLAFERVRASFGDPAAFGAAAGEMTARVLARLDAARAMAGGGAAHADLVAHLERETMPELEAERALAHTAGYGRLAAWLDQLVPEMSRAVTAARRTASALERDGAGFGAGTPRGGVGILAGTLAMLAKPATVPPRSPRRLVRSWPAGDATADLHLGVLSAFRPDLKPAIATVLANAEATPANPIRAYAFRLKCGMFGGNLPGKAIVEAAGEGSPGKVTFEAPDLNDVALPENQDPVENGLATIALDTQADRITIDSWVAIRHPGLQSDHTAAVAPTTTLHRVLGVRTATLSLEGVTSKSTLLTLTPAWLLDKPTAERRRDALASSAFLRGTVVYAQSEDLPLAEEPVTEPLCDGVERPIELQGLQSDLATGRWLIVSGERTDLGTTTGVQAAELVMIAGVQQKVGTYNPDPEKPGVEGESPLPGDKVHTFITLASPLAYCYRPDTVTIYGNVVNATHGETRKEILGGGDGAQAFQRFTLKAFPLTHVAAATPSGTRSTLEVRVNQVRWHEVDTLAFAGPADHSYVTKTDDEAKTTLTGGDGHRGARFPTGVENITAAYRTSLGKVGNVRQGQVTLLATKPLGVKGVVNPIRASGGADADTRDQARRNLPVAVRAFDRLVSTSDYADFARAFAGIGKAAAIRLPDGRRELVHVTIAGIDDIPILETSDLFGALSQALQELGDPGVPVQLAIRELVLLVLSAGVKLLPDYDWESVEPKIRKALLEIFGFDRRELARSATSSEAIAAIQNVPGVAYVDLDAFGGIPERVPSGAGDGVRNLITPEEIAERIGQLLQQPKPAGRVSVQGPGPEDGGIRPAQIALLSADVPDSLLLNLIR
jgi:uncharacterized phage protein gp47/JayE